MTRLKTTISRSIVHSILGVLSLLLGSNIVADDTEIFVSRGTSSSQTVKPNVLFILDNSGSMSGASYDANGNRSPLSRMENMKVAFEDVLKDAAGINVGLMTFNGDGGSILYPVVDIDQDLPSEDELESNIGMTSGADDAVELKSSGNVFVDDKTLLIAHTPDRDNVSNVVGLLEQASDNPEQGASSGDLYTNQFQFNMYSPQVNALRYFNLNIPNGATIVDARLEFTASRNDDGHVQLRWRAQRADNPLSFSNGALDVRNRYTQRSQNYVDWELTGQDAWQSGQKYVSPNLAPVIQEIVKQTYWDPNDALVLLVEHMTGTGQRAGTLRRDSGSGAADTQGETGSGTILRLTYTMNPSINQTIGLRFDNINIPKGAIVKSARIDFVSSNDNIDADAVQIQVKVENTGDAQPFSNNRYNLSSRTKFNDIVSWHPDDAWTFQQTVAGPDVKSLVQRVVSDSNGWCGGNAMAFFLEPKTNSDIMTRLAHAYEAGIGKKPTLTVSYTGGQGGCIQRKWTDQINAGENDAYQSGDKGTTYNSDSTLKFDSNNYLGLRFENVPLEPSSKVVEAYLELTAADNDTGSIRVTIAGEDDANAKAFPQSKKNLSRRATTTNTTAWDLNNWNSDQTYRSPDISSVINEIVAKSGWQSGNALALILQANSDNDRDFWAYDGSTGKAARLILRAESGAIAGNTNTVRWHEIELVKGLNPRGLTPATGALYEAALYFSGDDVAYGQSRNGNRYGRVSDGLSWTNGNLVRSSNCSEDDLDGYDCRTEYISGTPKYQSPITSACQSSHVVLLTDGDANQNYATNRIATLTGVGDCSNDSSISGEKCARTLARWMANEDLMPSFSGSINTVKTHTVAFNLSSTNAVRFLEDLAAEGDGGFYNVNTASDLTTAFDSILQSVRSTAATFVAPGATVNQFNRLSHRSEVYFSVFKPEATPRWDGNLKRYKLLGNPAVISDGNDKAAVDPLTGFFKETAQSVWSDAVDGAVVSKGGAASQRPSDPALIKTYTWLASNGLISKDLTASVNKVHEDNTLINASVLGITDAQKRQNVIRWTRGQDVLDFDKDSNTTEVRAQYEDPLHSVPRIITYGGTDANPDTAIYFGTNGGYLHAIDGSTGEELFSFVPESQLGLMETRFDNTDNFSHPYGVDGSPISWVQDVNGDNQIQANAGDFAYLYFGLRRGGNEYFALDVTERNTPKVLWHIQGGTGDFAQLGQTWSTPVKAKLKYDGSIVDVLIFGGGYNTAFDNASYTSGTSTGNAVYVVDAKTGTRLWYASSDALSSAGQRISDFKFPVAADIAVVDINGDGISEQLYVADVFGQVFRFDVNSQQTDATWIQGGLIAQLGDTSTPNNRRFFNAPDISLTSIVRQQKIAISIGSGSRPSPLSKATQDRFYMLLQDSVFRAPGSYTVIKTQDLVNQTSTITELTAANAGWYFDLPNAGEKVLSSSVTIAGKIVMTTYSPDSTATSCNPVVGTGRAYVFHLINAKAVADLDEDNSLEDTQDRSKTLASGNIPPSPKVLFPEDGAPTVLIGPEQPLQNVDFGLIKDWTQIYRRPEDVQ